MNNRKQIFVGSLGNGEVQWIFVSGLGMLGGAGKYLSFV